MTSDRKTQVRISPRTAVMLRKIAASFGFYQSRGTGAHTVGNVADMLDAVARGELQIVKTAAIDSQLDSLPKDDETH